MTREEFKARVSMALSDMNRETWEEFLESVWQLHLQASDNWISVEEELPKENQTVFICNEKRCYGVALYRDGEWLITREFVAINVTHWMPIMPPQGKD